MPAKQIICPANGKVSMRTGDFAMFARKVTKINQASAGTHVKKLNIRIKKQRAQKSSKKL